MFENEGFWGEHGQAAKLQAYNQAYSELILNNKNVCAPIPLIVVTSTHISESSLVCTSEFRCGKIQIHLSGNSSKT